jgi:beta-glucosidase
MIIKYSSNALIKIPVSYFVVLIALSISPLAKAATGNLTQGAAAYTWASSAENAGLSADAAIDGNSATRWSSAFSDPQWIAVDLGAVYSINHVVLNWEVAYGKAYKIEVSTNGTTWNPVFSVTNGNGGIDDLVFGATSARYVRMWGTARGTSYGYSLYEFEVYGATNDVIVVSAPTGNLAQVAWASSVEKTGLSAAAAVDGNSTTRWSSAFSDPQWIAVDLGAVYSINHVVLNWEAAYGKAYKIEVSTNGTTWNPVFSVTNGNGGIDDLVFGATNARYVRMWGTARGTPWGYSLWEIEVYGSGGGSVAGNGTSGGSTSDSGTTTTVTSTAPVTGTATTGSLALSWSAPVARADGTPLSLADIDGYRIHYGESSGNYTGHFTLSDGTAQNVTLTGLPVGTCYLVMTTYDVDGRESGYSSEVSKIVQ